MKSTSGMIEAGNVNYYVTCEREYPNPKGGI
jgi:hypothetical protein